MDIIFAAALVIAIQAIMSSPGPPINMTIVYDCKKWGVVVVGWGTKIRRVLRTRGWVTRVLLITYLVHYRVRQINPLWLYFEIGFVLLMIT